MRYASIDKVIGYVRKLKEELGMTVLTISDDQFLVNMKRAKEIFRQLEQFHIRVEILQGASVSFIDEEMVILMKKAGVKRVSLPLESGSKEMLEKMVSKPVDLDQARKVVGWLRKHGLWVQTFFVQGFPGETDEHRAEAVKWIMETGLDWSTFCQAIPIWGTKLYDICVEGGYIRPDMKLGELDFHNYTINVPGYPAEYVTREIYKMNLQCNFLNNYHMSQREYRIAANAFRKVVYMYPNHAFAHWFLAKCLEMMGNNAKEIGEHRDKFKEIVATDKNWAEYAKEFKLEE